MFGIELWAMSQSEIQVYNWREDKGIRVKYGYTGGTHDEVCA